MKACSGWRNCRWAVIASGVVRGVGPCLLGAVLMVTAGIAEAHRVDVAVRVVGRTVEGLARFHGGRPVTGAVVELRGASGDVLSTAVTDEGGRFAVPVSRREALEVVVLTADGHAARVRLAAEALPPVLEGPPRAEPRPNGEELASRVVESVGAEVARQLEPISDRLARLEGRVAIRDVLGGLGYLLGLAGVAAYLLARRRGDPRR